MAGNTLTRNELIEALVSDIGLTRQDSSTLLEDILEEIMSELIAGEQVKLARFGNFVVREKKPRIGRNPKTGVEAVISARRVSTFKPSPRLRDRVDAALNGG